MPGDIAQRARLGAALGQRPRRLALEIDDVGVALRDQHLAEMEVAVDAGRQSAPAPACEPVADARPAASRAASSSACGERSSVSSAVPAVARAASNAASSCSRAPLAPAVRRRCVGAVPARRPDRRSAAPARRASRRAAGRSRAAKAVVVRECVGLAPRRRLGDAELVDARACSWSSVQVQASPWLRTKPCATAERMRRRRRRRSAITSPSSGGDVGEAGVGQIAAHLGLGMHRRGDRGGTVSASPASSTISELFDCSADEPADLARRAASVSVSAMRAVGSKRISPSGVAIARASAQRREHRMREMPAARRRRSASRRAGRGAHGPARAGCGSGAGGSSSQTIASGSS